MCGRVGGEWVCGGRVEWEEIGVGKDWCGWREGWGGYGWEGAVWGRMVRVSGGSEVGRVDVDSSGEEGRVM